MACGGNLKKIESTTFQNISQKEIKCDINLIKTQDTLMWKSSANWFYMVFYGEERSVKLIRTDYEQKKHLKTFSTFDGFTLDKMTICPSDCRYLAGIDTNQELKIFEIQVVGHEDRRLEFHENYSKNLRVRELLWHPYDCKKILVLETSGKLHAINILKDQNPELLPNKWIAESAVWSFDAKYVIVKTTKDGLIVIFDENLENEYRFYVENLFEVCLLEKNILFYLYYTAKKDINYNLVQIDKKVKQNSFFKYFRSNLNFYLT